MTVPSASDEIPLPHAPNPEIGCKTATAPDIADERATKACPFCSEQILESARKCKYCGEFVDPQLQKERQLEALHQSKPANNAGIAAALTAVIPGLGQIYTGRVATGIGTLIVIALLMSAVPAFGVGPLLVFWLIAILDAYRHANPHRAQG
jgi:TM2 domain-containing membrane protein YozV